MDEAKEDEFTKGTAAAVPSERRKAGCFILEASGFLLPALSDRYTLIRTFYIPGEEIPCDVFLSQIET